MDVPLLPNHIYVLYPCDKGTEPRVDYSEKMPMGLDSKFPFFAVFEPPVIASRPDPRNVSKKVEQVRKVIKQEWCSMAKPGLVWFFLHPNLSLVLFRWVLGGCLVLGIKLTWLSWSLELDYVLQFAILYFMVNINIARHTIGVKSLIFSYK